MQADVSTDAEATARADEVARRLLALMPRLQGWAAAAVQANRREQDPSLRQIAVLYVIREGATSPGQVARRLRITPAVVTGLLDRLEQRDLVRREADPSDRRRLRVALTEAGLATSVATQRMLIGEMAARLATAPSADLDAAERTLRLLGEVLDALEKRTPTPADGDGDGDAWDDPEAGRATDDRVRVRRAAG